MDDALYGPGTPVFGKPSILWASLTLAVLTLPVVIVTTEEALRTVPRELRDASLALGATRFQTIYKVILPNARGGILTGVILAVSRGAGEVAPIIFCGAANFLPYLPTDLRDMFMLQRQENEAFVGLRISQNPALCYVFDGRGKAFMLPISGERDELLDRDLLEGVHAHRRVLGQVRILLVAA
jgi:ABC-type phosphate transport system permease subunit